MPATQEDLIRSTLEIGGTMAVVAIGLGAIAYARRLARDRATAASTSGGLLDEFRRAYEAGEMDEEEFQKVRDALTGRKHRPAAEPAPEDRPEEGA